MGDTNPDGKDDELSITDSKHHFHFDTEDLYQLDYKPEVKGSDLQNSIKFYMTHKKEKNKDTATTAAALFLQELD